MSDPTTPAPRPRRGTVQTISIFGTVPGYGGAGGGTGRVEFVGPKDSSGAGGAAPGGGGRAREPEAHDPLDLRRGVEGTQDRRGDPHPLLEGRPTVGREDTGRRPGSRAPMGDREPRLAEPVRRDPTGPDRPEARISPARVAGLVTFVCGAVVILYAFGVGWHDESLGYADVMMLGLGLEILGVALWRP